MNMLYYDSERHVIYVTCIICGNEYEIHCSPEQWKMLFSENRPYIQDIFPELSAEARELLISKVCPNCWNKMFEEDK